MSQIVTDDIRERLLKQKRDDRNKFGDSLVFIIFVMFIFWVLINFIIGVLGMVHIIELELSFIDYRIVSAAFILACIMIFFINFRSRQFYKRLEYEELTYDHITIKIKHEVQHSGRSGSTNSRGSSSAGSASHTSYYVKYVIDGTVDVKRKQINKREYKKINVGDNLIMINVPFRKLNNKFILF